MGQSSFNIDFPGSLLAYSAGGILVDVEYRLFTVPFSLWLISSVLLRGRGQVRTFWVLATPYCAETGSGAGGCYAASR